MMDMKDMEDMVDMEDMEGMVDMVGKVDMKQLVDMELDMGVDHFNGWKESGHQAAVSDC